MNRQCSEFRFYEELNDFLPREKRKRAFLAPFSDSPSIKDAIESLGIPPSEVDLVLVDGEAASFDRLLSGGERVAVYPAFERFDISSLTRLRDRPLRNPRFILAPGLGDLARTLQNHGFDALYRPGWDDRTLVEIAAGEKRILLTTEGSLLGSPEVVRGYRLKTKEVRDQLREILRAFDLGRVPDQLQP